MNLLAIFTGIVACLDKGRPGLRLENSTTEKLLKITCRCITKLNDDFSSKQSFEEKSYTINMTMKIFEMKTY